MHALQSLLFSTRLAISLAWYSSVFAFDYGIQKMWKYRVTLAILLVIAVVALSWLAQIYTQPQVSLEEEITNNIEYTIDLEKTSLTKAQAQQELESLLLIEEYQPHNRDVLINIALLYDALGEKSSATPYWNAARELDPNHPIFSE